MEIKKERGIGGDDKGVKDPKVLVGEPNWAPCSFHSRYIRVQKQTTANLSRRPPTRAKLTPPSPPTNTRSLTQARKHNLKSGPVRDQPKQRPTDKSGRPQRTTQESNQERLDDVLLAKALEPPVSDGAGEQDDQLGPVGSAPARFPAECQASRCRCVAARIFLFTAANKPSQRSGAHTSLSVPHA
jgi:hypothetical protein